MMNYGYLVCEMDINADVQKAEYQGFAKYYPWPLGGCADSISVALSKELYTQWLKYPVDSFGRYSLMLLDDYDYIVRYCEHCRLLSIGVQVYYVEGSAAQEFSFSHENSFFEFLGWDYIASVDASYLFDDGDYLMKKYVSHADLLNENGLFATLQNAQQYAMVRKLALMNGDNIELLGDEFFVRVFRCSTDSQKAGNGSLSSTQQKGVDCDGTMEA